MLLEAEESKEQNVRQREEIYGFMNPSSWSRESEEKEEEVAKRVWYLSKDFV